MNITAVIRYNRDSSHKNVTYAAFTLIFLEKRIDDRINPDSKNLAFFIISVFLNHSPKYLLQN